MTTWLESILSESMAAGVSSCNMRNSRSRSFGMYMWLDQGLDRIDTLFQNYFDGLVNVLWTLLCGSATQLCLRPCAQLPSLSFWQPWLKPPGCPTSSIAPTMWPSWHLTTPPSMARMGFWACSLLTTSPWSRSPLREYHSPHPPSTDTSKSSSCWHRISVNAIW